MDGPFSIVVRFLGIGAEVFPGLSLSGTAYQDFRNISYRLFRTTSVYRLQLKQRKLLRLVGSSSIVTILRVDVGFFLKSNRNPAGVGTFLENKVVWGICGG